MPKPRRFRLFSNFYSLPDEGLPAEFRVFPLGRVETDLGTFLFTREDAEELMRRYFRKGTQISIDYEHQALEGPPPAPAAGWADLELRDDGLWAVRVTWTQRAAEFLRQREYRYFSPAFITERRKDGEHIVELVNIALTNIPATHHLEPLVARAVQFRAGRVIERESWDADAAESRVRKWASSDGSGEKETIDWEKYRQAFAWYDAENPENFGSYKLIHHDVVDDELVVVKPGVQAAAAALQGARGGVDIPESDMDAVRRHIAQHYHQWDEEAPWERESKTEEEVSMSKMEVEQELLRLTEAATPHEALGVVLAWKRARDQVETLTRRVAELEDIIRTREVEELVRSGLADGKLTPALEQWARELGRRDVELLRGYLRAAPRFVASAVPQEPPAEVTPEQFAKMNWTERAELYSRSPELYRKLAETIKDRG